MELPWPFPENHDHHHEASVDYYQPTFDASGKCIFSSPTGDITSKDFPWPLPVRQYERALASVLDSKPEVDQCGNTIYHTYAIRYSVVEVGLDSAQQLASDFALVTPGPLDSEVAHMTVNLFLPWQACVKANVSECQCVALDPDQVDLAKRFNTWLFDVVLGKPPVSSGAMPILSKSDFVDSPKGYYVLPLQPNNMSGPAEFDWSVVISSLTSGLIYRKKVNFFGGFAKLESGDIDFDRGALEPGEIIMRNGNFTAEELDDAIITCAHNGMPCYVSAISKHINGGSRFPSADSAGSPTYADYYASKCEYRLKYDSQSFLKGRRLIRAANYLKRQEADTARGKVAPRSTETLELPPEICSVHAGVKGKLLRGAMRLPSVLYSLETALLAAELRDVIGVPISCFKVQEALTSRACQGDVSYEALELLGDSILKVTGCTYLFLKEFLKTDEQLSATLYELVRNKTLFYCALPRSLARYAFVEPFGPSLWVPPGGIRVESGQNSCPEREERRKFQLVSCKTLADIVEALLGAYLMEGGLDMALRTMAWLCVPIKFPTSVPEPVTASLFGTTSCVELCELVNVGELESTLGYRFKNKNLLAGALKYEFQDCNENALFKRLVFLGDGIFDFVITRHLIRAYPDQDEGKLSELKQAIRNNQNLAGVVVLHGLHTHLRRVSPSLELPIAEYISTFLKEGGKAFGLSTLCAPRGLGDLLQTLAAAIYLDSNLDIELVWRVLRPLLEPLATPLTVTLHPIKQLETLCVEKGWSLKIHVNHLEKCVQAEVWINESVMGNWQNEDKKVARRLAATMALRGISHQTSIPPVEAC
ncbi:unnamed protein product [Calypogeia fissa]